MNGNTILYIEDNDEDAQLFRRAMDNRGLKIIDCRSIQDAHEKIKAYNKFRLVFVDLKINGQSTVPLIRWIRDNYPAMPVVVLTGSLDLTVSAVDQLLENGADRAFAKPLSQHNILDVMQLYNRTGANFENGKPKRSWRTSLFAGLAAAVAGYSWKFQAPDYMPLAVGLLSLGVAFSADSSVLWRALELVVKKK